MTDFRRLTNDFWASPQITTAEVAEAAAQGFALIVNNRPDGEAEDQPEGATIADAAHEHGLAYVAIPVGHEGFGEEQVTAMGEALAQADGKVLAYCRSGTRSTFLWALAEAARGTDPQTIAAAAAAGGYDVSPIAATLDMLAARAEG